MGEAERDDEVALPGVPSHARKPPSDDSVEGVRKEEDLLWAHAAHYMKTGGSVNRRHDSPVHIAAVPPTS